MKPRVGFLGVGWIGRHRMEAILAADIVDAVAVSDPSDAMADAALALAPDACRSDDLEALLALDLDGVVIATPSALHAQQSIAALERGVAVFCQKPLGRTGAEAKGVVDAARRADRLLGVDLSYRHTEAARALRTLIEDGALGRIYAADLVFHNAYGPDKAWFYDAELSGGGCVADLGVHLVDLACWLLGWPEVTQVESHLYRRGAQLRADSVEDYAVAALTLSTGAIVRIACSWRLHAGQDAVISAAFYGVEGGAELRNLSGSFYDFEALLYRGTQCERLVAPPDAWGGRAAVTWARRLAKSRAYDAEIEHVLAVANVIDCIYQR